MATVVFIRVPLSFLQVMAVAQTLAVLDVMPDRGGGWLRSRNPRRGISWPLHYQVFHTTGTRGTLAAAAGGRPRC